MTRQEVDNYFSERMQDGTFREAMLSYLEMYDQDAWINFKKTAVTDADRAYFQGVGRGCDEMKRYFTSITGTQKAIKKLKKQIEDDK